MPNRNDAVTYNEIKKRTNIYIHISNFYLVALYDIPMKLNIFMVVKLSGRHYFIIIILIIIYISSGTRCSMLLYINHQIHVAGPYN